MTEVAAAGTPGLRERKKQRTRESIQREAMRLFRASGYEATTVQQIADAADISVSTFFNYFPTKEDVVFADDYDPMIAAAFLARPPDEPAGIAFRRAFRSLAGIMERDRDLIMERVELSFSVPALRAKLWDNLEQARDMACTMLAGRTGRDRDDFDVRVSAMVVVAAMMEAMMHWVRSAGKEDISELVDRALDLAGTDTLLGDTGGGAGQS
jgi:AcrR family transcriptional regulator